MVWYRVRVLESQRHIPTKNFPSTSIPGPLLTLLCKLICVHLSLAFVQDTCSTKFFILAQGRVVFKKSCLFVSFCLRLAATFYCFISFLTYFEGKQ